MRSTTSFEFNDSPQLAVDEYTAEVPANLRSSQALLEALYERLALPGYFGFNWNALSDCLRDLHWLKERVVVLRHADLPGLSSDDLQNYLEVLAEAVETWRVRGQQHVLRVILPVESEEAVTRLFP